MKAFQDNFDHDEVEAEAIPAAKDITDMGDNKGLATVLPTCEDCAEILHGLNNVLAGMLLNAQVMEWKLPSYSRSKRYLHEIERNAQRGGELVKRLLLRLQSGCRPGLRSSGVCAGVGAGGHVDLLMVSDDGDGGVKSAGVTITPVIHGAPVFDSDRKKVTHTIV